MKPTINRPALMIAAIIFLASAIACQQTAQNGNANTSTTTSTNNNSTSTNTNTQTATNTNQSQARTTGAATEGGSLATPTETYKTAYAVRQKKDIEGLKRVFAKEALEFLTEIGKEEKKTLDDQLKALADRPQAPTAETRNEKIEGDRATLEYLNEKGGWSTMDFVKEGNDWKIGLPKAQ